MKRIDMVRMQKEHLMELLDEREPGLRDCARHERTAEARLSTGSSYAFFSAYGRLLACAGITVYWPGMGEAWLLLSNYALEHHVRDIVTETPKVLNQFHLDHSLRRIQADVVATNQKAINFVKHFGFIAEGLMKCYDVLGRDNIRFARIWEVKHGEPG